MTELFTFLQSFEIPIYMGLGIFIAFFMRNLLRSLSEWRNSQFGLEKENARRRFYSAVTALSLLVLFGLAEFLIATFIIPGLPKNIAPVTPTLNVHVETTVLPTDMGAKVQAVPGIIQNGTQSVAQIPAPTGSPAATQAVAESCTKGQIEWTYPLGGDKLRGKVQLKGTINVPNLGFYKYEFSQPGNSLWTTIAANNENKKIDAVLGTWDTNTITPGDYLLRLVATDNQNQLLPACVVQIQIVAP